ncbi:(2Fe-2S)-binding protein [Aliikangiella marina]|uniref:Bacterioferritin-associated ferredoxin n=1 Tax=Aliikangiella marina TaxID=1712262 RepID=A0A545TJA2_9GAMM|nr:bacterioferritin-associated ferredoxin [Aliikangiella marina]TQV77295.1 (2Fe-2S)-binding protein [Aliikangiella marina]
MYVCICNAVTDSDIIEAKNNGHTKLKDITRQLGVGNCCGRCVETAKEILDSHVGVQKYVPNLSGAPQLVPA